LGLLRFLAHKYTPKRPAAIDYTKFTELSLATTPVYGNYKLDKAVCKWINYSKFVIIKDFGVN
jgi:hypothetical protein